MNTNHSKQHFTLLIHGGAGVISRASLTAEMEAAFRAALKSALLTGHALLKNGASSVDAVTAVIQVLEDEPLFNAGKGAVLTSEGKIELDAALMDGHSGQAGAVAGVSTIKNPITAARAVLLHSPHVLLIGAGAERFAAEQQLELVDSSYFYTPLRIEQLRLAQAKDQIQLDHSATPDVPTAPMAPMAPMALWETDHKFGTVGAVALDQHGNLAAGTSTGGMTNKRYGRVGDSPIIGAGTFADNASAAVSCTGTGEFFMRGVLAYDIAARMKYAGSNLSEAVAQAIDSALTQRGGSGGVIALDAAGNTQFGFNTEGMYRGYIRSDGQPVVLIFKDE